MTSNSRSKADGARKRARLFWNGRSQAVRLPLEFRFDGDEVEIRREGDAVILEPVRRRTWPKDFWTWVDAHREEMEMGDIDELTGGLLDVTLEDD